MNQRIALLFCSSLGLLACTDALNLDPSDAGADSLVDGGSDVAADTEEDGDLRDDTQPDPDTSADADVTEPDLGDVDAGPAPPNPDCDPLVELECAMPWPSNLYLETDNARATGVTLSFGDTSLPRNFRRIHLRPDVYRRMDGFGVSTPIIVHYPRVDLTGVATDLNVPPSLNDDAPIQLFQVTEGELTRIPYFAELDAWEDDPDVQALWVRPAVILEEAAQYIVVFKTGLRNDDGEPFERTPAFQALIDGSAEDDDLLRDRVERFEDTFELLEDNGIPRADLLLAWDFTTASSDAMHSRMLEIRREGFEATGPDGPPMTITEWTDYTTEEHPHWASVVRGYLTVPHFMREDVVEDSTGSVTGWTFNEQTDGNGLVEQNGTREAEFWIGVPHTATDGTPHGLAQYGHGFFGLGDGTIGSWTPNGQLGNEGNLIWFGSNWTGMSDYDFGNIQFAVFDLNHFKWLPDRMHQGQLEFLLFARAMRERFQQLPEAVERGLVVDPERIYYEGISQGGINGATYMALTNDIQRGHLGVPGQNYALLTHRSENFDQFFTALAGSYPGRSQQAVLLACVQTLWDPMDPASYYRHIITDPFEDDEPRQILATPALGDHSVTPVSMEIVARTPGLGLELFQFSPDRTLDLAEAGTLPSTGSGLVFYSWPGQRRLESVNRPAPRGEVNVHDAQRRLPEHQQQMLHFFDTGEIIDTCSDGVCDPN